MKWEKALDDALTGKMRRDKVEIPTGLLRRMKTDKQRLVEKAKITDYFVAREFERIGYLLDGIASVCESSGKSNLKIKEIQQMLSDFIEDNDILEELGDDLVVDEDNMKSE